MFVTSYFEKACKFCRAKLSNQPNNIGDEATKTVVSSNVRNNLTPHEDQFSEDQYLSSFRCSFEQSFSVTSVNLTGSEHTFILAQLIFQSWSAAGTEDSRRQCFNSRCF